MVLKLFVFRPKQLANSREGSTPPQKYQGCNILKLPASDRIPTMNPSYKESSPAASIRWGIFSSATWGMRSCKIMQGEAIVPEFVEGEAAITSYIYRN